MYSNTCIWSEKDPKPDPMIFILLDVGDTYKAVREPAAGHPRTGYTSDPCRASRSHQHSWTHLKGTQAESNNSRTMAYN